jgi:hypothetical protein
LAALRSPRSPRNGLHLSPPAAAFAGAAAGCSSGSSCTKDQRQQQHLDVLEKRLSQMQSSFSRLFTSSSARCSGTGMAAPHTAAILTSNASTVYVPTINSIPILASDVSGYARGWLVEQATRHSQQQQGSRPASPTEQVFPAVSVQLPAPAQQLPSRFEEDLEALEAGHQRSMAAAAAAAAASNAPSPSLRELAASALGEPELGEAAVLPLELEPSGYTASMASASTVDVAAARQAASAAACSVRALSWAIETDTLRSRAHHQPGGSSTTAVRLGGAVSVGWVGAAMMSPEPSSFAAGAAGAAARRPASGASSPRPASGLRTPTSPAAAQALAASGRQSPRDLLPEAPASPRQSWYPGSFKTGSAAGEKVDTEDLEADLGPPGG